MESSASAGDSSLNDTKPGLNLSDNVLFVTRPIKIYTDMCGDLFHIGHVKLLRRLKLVFGSFSSTLLTVGVHSDADIAAYKRKPIVCEESRYGMVEAYQSNL